MLQNIPRRLFNNSLEMHNDYPKSTVAMTFLREGKVFGHPLLLLFQLRGVIMQRGTLIAFGKLQTLIINVHTSVILAAVIALAPKIFTLNVVDTICQCLINDHSVVQCSFLMILGIWASWTILIGDVRTQLSTYLPFKTMVKISLTSNLTLNCLWKAF